MNKSISIWTVKTSDKTEIRPLQINLLRIYFSIRSKLTALLALIKNHLVTTPLSKFPLCQNCPLLRLLAGGRRKEFFLLNATQAILCSNTNDIL